MKKMLLAVSAGICLLLQNCSTDFEINGIYRETPAVYALLDASETTQYIRIDRAFLQGNENALTLALDPEQVYYGDELDVRIDEFNNGTFVGSYALERVDGDTLGIPKQEGIFVNLPNILYRFSATLNQDHTYKIVGTDTITGATFSAEAGIVNTFKVTNPNDDYLFPQFFAVSPAGKYFFKWTSAKDAHFYDLIIRFEYREGIYNLDGSITFTDTSYLDWKFATNYVNDDIDGGSPLTYELDGKSFYTFIQNSVEPNPDINVIRISDSVKFIVNAGGIELYNFYQFTNASLGITEGQAGDVYTNVDGGLGVFSSRFHRETKYYAVGSQTRDSIACSSITQGLNFAPEFSTDGFPYCTE